MPIRGAQAVDRALDLLDVLADAETALPLSSLAASAGLAAPTTHRLLASLLAHGYVRQDGSRRYLLGPRLVLLGRRADRRLAGWARPHLAALRDATGETTNLALLDGDEIVYLAQAPGRHQMRMFTEPGRRVSAHATAVGKALLAGLPDDEVRALLARTGMPARTGATITDPDGFLEHLVTVRARGWAVDDEEQEAGVRCLGAAVVGAPGPMALSVSGPSGRLRDEALAGLGARLLATAARLAGALARPAASDRVPPGR